jgi:hypothetical protein
MLPRVMPMLAVAAEPFDSPEYCFEVKWDLRQVKPGKGGCTCRKHCGNLSRKPCGYPAPPRKA